MPMDQTSQSEDGLKGGEKYAQFSALLHLETEGNNNDDSSMTLSPQRPCKMGGVFTFPR